MLQKSVDLLCERGFTLRAILIGFILGSVLASSNVYLALKIGAFNSGSILGAIIGGQVLNFLGSSNLLFETNVVHSVTSAGANFSGAYFDSIPVAANFGFLPNYLTMMAFLAFGGMIGISLVVLFRRYLVVEERLPFPSGIATANTLKAISDKKVVNKKMKLLAGGFVLSASIILLQSSVLGSIIPASFDMTPKLPKGFMLGISLSPMLVAFGFIMGFKSSAGYLIGNVLTGLVFSPYLLSNNIIQEAQWVPVAKIIASPASGLLIGGTIFSMIVNYRSLINSFKVLMHVRIKASSDSAEGSMDKDLPIFIPLSIIAIGTIALAIIFQQYTSILLFPLIVLLAFLFGLVAARTTGETGLCPTSLFVWISIAIIGAAVTRSPGIIAFLAGIIAVSVGQASDSTNDLKTAFLIKSSPGTVEIAEYIGLLSGVLVAPLAFNVIINAYGIFNEQFPVPFGMVAKEIIESVSRGGNPFDIITLGVGLAIGAIMTIFKLPALPVGLGMFAPLSFGCTVFLGGILRKFMSKNESKDDDGITFFSGVFAGEGIIGVVIAALIVFFG